MNGRISRWLAILLFFSTTMACAQFLPGTSASAPAGKIVFQSDRDGNFELYMVDVHGGTPVRLTNNSSNDVSPAFIQSTNQIGFSSDRGNDWNLYTIDRLGKNLKAVTDRKNTPVDYPSWSPDGSLIAASLTENCVAPAKTCFYDIYTMLADGSDLKRLTDTPASEWVPDWSPDGQKIAFSSDRDGDTEVYSMNRDGSGLVQLTKNNGYDGRPRWSPDGSKIVFETDRDGGDWDIYIMNADGSDPKPVTSNSTNDFAAAWSPDGNWLVYVSDSTGSNELFTININGQNQQRLTNNTANDTAPIWIP